MRKRPKQVYTRMLFSTFFHFHFRQFRNNLSRVICYWYILCWLVSLKHRQKCNYLVLASFTIITLNNYVYPFPSNILRTYLVYYMYSKVCVIIFFLLTAVWTFTLGSLKLAFIISTSTPKRVASHTWTVSRKESL